MSSKPVTRDEVSEDLEFMDPEIEVLGPMDDTGANITGYGTANVFAMYLAKAYQESMIDAITAQRNGKRVAPKQILDSVIEKLDGWECI